MKAVVACLAMVVLGAGLFVTFIWDPGTSARPSNEPAPAVSTAPDPFPPELDGTRFRHQVLAHLRGEARSSAVASDPGPERGGPRAGARLSRGRLPRDGVDWDYLEEVAQGRVSGIPNEKRAGLSLREIDRAVRVPYFERLREAGRTRELEDLGVYAPPDWQVCAAQGSCFDRPDDGGWRPPGAPVPPESAPKEVAGIQPTPLQRCLAEGTCFDRPDGEPWTVPY